MRRWEGLRLEAYLDQAGVWTIGYGHTLSARPGMSISRDAAARLLEQDLKPRFLAVEALEEERIAAGGAPLTPAQYAALVSLCFNIGVAAFRASRAVTARVRAGEDFAAADGFLRWVHVTVDGRLRVSRGLRARREEERRLYLSAAPRRRAGDGAPFGAGAADGAVSEDAKPLARSKTIAAAGAGGAAALGAAAPTLPQAAAALCGAVAVAAFVYIAWDRWRGRQAGEWK
ncbi:MAG: lysozyme [Pseudomonadota bacterium]